MGRLRRLATGGGFCEYYQPGDILRFSPVRQCGADFPAINDQTDRGHSYMSQAIMHVSDDSFEDEVLKADAPVLVDYWAEWCGPCKMIAPVLEEIAREYAGKIKVTKLNIDENTQTPRKYGIRGIPTLMLFKNGNVEATKVGAVSKSQLTAFLDGNL
jgi:thioredoxin 1